MKCLSSNLKKVSKVCKKKHLWRFLFGYYENSNAMVKSDCVFAASFTDFSIAITNFSSRFYIVILEIVFFFVTFYLLFILYSDFYFPFSIWTFVSLFYLDFCFPFLFGLLFLFWTFISLFTQIAIWSWFRVFFYPMYLLVMSSSWIFLAPASPSYENSEPSRAGAP